MATNGDSCTYFRYGNYRLKPAPLFNSSATLLKTPDGSGYGVIHNVTFNGSILLTGVQERESGILGVFQEIDRFHDAFNRDGRELYVAISGFGEPIENSTGLFSGFPIIESYNINPRPSNDNFVFGADYDFTLNMITFRRPRQNPAAGQKAFYGDPFNGNTGLEGLPRELPNMPPFIESMDESWDVEMDQEVAPVIFATPSGSGAEITPFYATINHTIDVQARLVYSGWNASTDEVQKSDPFVDARTWVTGLLMDKEAAFGRKQDLRKYGFLSGVLRLDEVNLLSGEAWTEMVKDHYRTVSLNRTNGTIQVKESFFVAPQQTSGAVQNNSARESFEISTNFSDGLWTFSINGEIRGFDSNQYINSSGFEWGVNGSDRWRSARDYWDTVAKDRIRPRLQIARESVDSGQGDCAEYVGVLPLSPTQKTIGFNPHAGTVSYDYTFEIFPNKLDCTGYCIRSQQIRVEDTDVTDVFASHVIIGRSQGPLLQDIGTVTAKSRAISVELVVPPPTSLESGYIYQNFPQDCVTNLISTLTGSLTPAPDQIFITQNTESLGITDGNYARQFAVTYTQCAP